MFYLHLFNRNCHQHHHHRLCVINLLDVYVHQYFIFGVIEILFNQYYLLFKIRYDAKAHLSFIRCYTVSIFSGIFLRGASFLRNVT